MNRTTKKIFKYISKHQKPPICIRDVSDHFSKMSFQLSVKCCQDLEKENLICFDDGNIFLTTDGKDYFYNIWIARIKTILSLIVIPILVSYITTKLTVGNNQCSNNTYNYNYDNIQK